MINKYEFDRLNSLSIKFLEAFDVNLKNTANFGADVKDLAGYFAQAEIIEQTYKFQVMDMTFLIYPTITSIPKKRIVYKTKEVGLGLQKDVEVPIDSLTISYDEKGYFDMEELRSNTSGKLIPDVFDEYLRRLKKYVDEQFDSRD